MTLLLRPLCWCDLERFGSQDDPIELQFVDNGPAPIILNCTDFSSDDLSDTRKAFRLHSSANAAAYPFGSPFEGSGWMGFKVRLNYRRYYWLGGFAASTEALYAWLFPKTAAKPVMELWYIPEGIPEGFDLGVDTLVLLIEYPSPPDVQ